LAVHIVDTVGNHLLDVIKLGQVSSLEIKHAGHGQIAYLTSAMKGFARTIQNSKDSWLQDCSSKK
jgi:hypothetical protein